MKKDFYGQLCLVVALLVLISFYPMFPVVLFYVRIVLIPLAIWQLVSAAINTKRFKQHKIKIAKLSNYWKFASACIFLFTATVLINKIKSAWTTTTLVLFITSLVGSIVVAVYYLFIYKKYLLKNDL